MTRKLLCPTDGSDHATLGVHKAVDLARLTGAKLTVCVVNMAMVRRVGRSSIT